ncbi:enoyl-CoA hydratase/isomerase family protein [Nocardioides pantholopis]|uniref:enoyl-CoA hydratase/isomerase family protein n=1 Tax=Nocardioides pantholopis TaxID=2483798 RepID=UPI0013DDCA9E|nr:enoyl-CoA hydratase/isomerase family protein [Nocardioides pantholopis]
MTPIPTRAAAVTYAAADDVGTVTLGEPGRVFVLDGAAVDALESAVDQVERDRPCCLVVVGGGRVFCAGADLEELARLDPPAFGSWNERLARVATRLAELPMPVVAALNGAALGGGLELALAADHRIADPAASVGLPEVGLGFMPGAGGVRRLTRLLGPHRARWLILRGTRLSAAEALEAGLVDEIHADPPARAHEFAEEFRGTSAAALAAVKRAVDTAYSPDAHAIEQELIGALFDTDACRQAIAGFVAARSRRRATAATGTR